MLIQNKNWKKVKLIGITHDKLYRLQFESPKVMINKSDGKILGELWHRCSWHIYHEAMKTIKHVVTGISKLSTKHGDMCKVCVEGKLSKRMFTKSDNRDEDVLVLVHLDICGPMYT